jgi:hypothetical protein
MFSWLGAGPTWLFSACVMGALLATSALLDRPVLRSRAAVSSAEPSEPATAPTTIV